jgi:hypothetical protein
MTKPRLFAVTLGGRAPKANTELHDVVFVTGSTIDDTYTQLLDKWFGNPVGLHLDSWLELDVVDGWRISLSPTADAGGQKLFFVNLGAYDENFTELHANAFTSQNRRSTPRSARSANFSKAAKRCRTRTTCTRSTIVSRWTR